MGRVNLARDQLSSSDAIARLCVQHNVSDLKPYTMSLTATLAVWCSHGGSIQPLNILPSLILHMCIVCLSLAEDLASVFERGEGKFGEGAAE